MDNSYDKLVVLPSPLTMGTSTTTTLLSLSPASIDALSLISTAKQALLPPAPYPPHPVVHTNASPPLLLFPDNNTKTSDPLHGSNTTTNNTFPRNNNKTNDVLQHSFLPPDVEEDFDAVNNNTLSRIQKLSSLPAPTLDKPSLNTESCNSKNQSANRYNIKPIQSISWVLITYVFAILFEYNEDSLQGIRWKFFDFWGVIKADLNPFLLFGILIHNQVNPWHLFQQLATLCDWAQASEVLAFTKAD